jgi:hypothetical protein
MRLATTLPFLGLVLVLLFFAFATTSSSTSSGFRLDGLRFAPKSDRAVSKTLSLLALLTRCLGLNSAEVSPYFVKKWRSPFGEVLPKATYTTLLLPLSNKLLKPPPIVVVNEPHKRQRFAVSYINAFGQRPSSARQTFRASVHVHTSALFL